ncbi:MAG: hypothetical protein U0T77_10865 [Chitinophagales bacterium]
MITTAILPEVEIISLPYRLTGKVIHLNAYILWISDFGSSTAKTNRKMGWA